MHQSTATKLPQNWLSVPTFSAEARGIIFAWLSRNPSVP